MRAHRAWPASRRRRRDFSRIEFLIAKTIAPISFLHKTMSPYFWNNRSRWRRSCAPRLRRRDCSFALLPSYERIAEAARCARSTVGEALKALEDAGVLSWVKRVREACPDLLGAEGWRWRVLRTSNSHAFTDPSQRPSVRILLSPKISLEHKNQAFIPLLVRAAAASDALEASLSHWSTGVQSRNGA
jgi:hypothetical protein